MCELVEKGVAMNKRIVWSIILVPFLVIGLIFAVGCGESEPTSKMTAPEVCQYVNQALPNEYRYQSSTARYEIRYTALSAEHLGEGIWQVRVKTIAEPQRLKEGQWVFGTGMGGGIPVFVQYQFNETTGALTIKRVMP